MFIHKGCKSRLSLGWLAIFVSTSVVWAQSAPNVTMTVSPTEGGDQTVVQIISWDGNTPSEVSVLLPGDSSPTTESVEAQYLGSQWQQQYVDVDGWTHGQLTTPTAGHQNVVYAVKYRVSPTDSNAADIVYSPADDPSQSLSVHATYPPGTYPQGVGTIIIIVIIGAVIVGCVIANGLARAECSRSADNICVADHGGTKSSTFSGLCGMGRCHVECNDGYQQ